MSCSDDSQQQERCPRVPVEESHACIDATLRIHQLRNESAPQLENELAAAKSRYQCLYDNLPVMCVSVDGQGRISDCNAAFSASLSVARSDIIGALLPDFFSRGDRKAVASLLDPGISVEGGLRQETFAMSHLDEEGDPVRVRIRSSHLGSDGSGPSTVVILEDASRGLKLEKQQKLARQHLYRSSRLASVGTLASGVAHELNNPLAAILGFSDALLSRLKNGEIVDRGDLGEYLGIINSETLRCRDIVENLSRLAKNYDSSVELVPLVDCLQSAIALMRGPAQRKNIRIVNEVPSGITVRTDAQKVGQVLVNVLANAVDFCGSGCVVRISVEKPSSSVNRAEVHISDSGPGIAPDVLPRIFDPFFTTKEVGRGIGMGLTVSHRLMQECGGSIDVLSRDGKGTTVVLGMAQE